MSAGTFEAPKAPTLASPLHPALPSQTRGHPNPQLPAVLPAQPGSSRDQASGGGRQVIFVITKTLISRPHMPLSPSSLGQDQLLFPLQPIPFFQSGKVLSTFFFFLKAQGGYKYKKKGDIYSKPCPSSSLFKYFTASFPFPIKKEKVWQTRLDRGGGNRGLLHHPRQIMPPIMQATHSHCRLHANGGVISPSLEHKRALTLFTQPSKDWASLG